MWEAIKYLAFAVTLVVAILAQGCGHERQPLQSACDFLWSKQGDDGAWHSETHGILRSGEALTPFILWHLLQADSDLHDQHDIDRALAFIRKTVKSKFNTTEQQVLDYPNYAMAYSLRVLHSYGVAKDTSIIRQMASHLRAQQYAEHRGVSPDHPAYGGWGFGETNLAHGKVGHVDISHTRRVLEALKPFCAPDDSVFVKAAAYFHKHQNQYNTKYEWADGGFFSSLYSYQMNKSLPVPDTNRWYSYATATCDGLLGLAALPKSLSEKQIDDVMEWLSQNSELDYPAGIPENDPMQWHMAMRIYHLCVRAEASVATGNYDSLPEVAARILSFQNADGSYSNPYGAANKEDDPLLGTAMAVYVLDAIATP